MNTEQGVFFFKMLKVSMSVRQFQSKSLNERKAEGKRSI